MLAPSHPVRRHSLNLTEAPAASDHGLPLGDGLVGALIWGDGRPLNLSLDRADLWDLRSIPEYHRDDYRWDAVVRAHREGRHDELFERLEAPYGRAGPSRLSAGRLTLAFPAPAVLWRLESATGVATVRFADGALLEAFIATNASVGHLRVRGATPLVGLVRPPFGEPPEDLAPEGGPGLSRHNAWELGYPPPTTTETPGLLGYSQAGFGDFAFAVAVAQGAADGAWRAAWRIEAGHGDPDRIWSAAAQLSREALLEGFDAAAGGRAAWWADYWSRGRVDLPEFDLERVYYSGMAQLGGASRRDGPPASLQGVWTTDDGRLPPWKGDYHHDLNTQMVYWPVYAGDQLVAGLGFLEWLWQTREACREWTARFYGVPGLNVPMTADLANRQIGGWRQYTHSVATGAWLAHHFHLHWRYSQDRRFLAERAFPYLTEVCLFVEAISETRDPDGFRSVALSSSPEVGDNRPEAWFETFTNYELSLFRWVLEATASMADALDIDREAGRWRGVLGELPPLSLSETGELLVAPGHAYPGHHRHFSHAVAVHPLASLDGVDGPLEQRRVARATVEAIGGASKSFWMGYSHAWQAALAARVGDGEAARQALRDYQTAFVFPNGFHANGDWRGLGYGRAAFGAFTLEGAMGAADAVQTMLLQSAPGRVRLFPALPADWRTVSFEGLRADGAVLVSASVVDGQLLRVSFMPEVSGRLSVGVFGNEARLDVELVAGVRFSLDADGLETLAGHGGGPGHALTSDRGHLPG